MKTDIKSILLYAAIAVLLILLFISRCSRSKQDQESSVSQVAQNRIENLEANIAKLEGREIVYRTSQDSMIRINEALNRLLIQNRAKYAVIALNYEKEKQRVKDLPDDTAVGLFLDRADCGEVQIKKYDDDYLISIEPVRFYNDLAVGFDEQISINKNLRTETRIYTVKIKTLDEIISGKEMHISDLNAKIEAFKSIESEKDKQIVAEQKKIKQQKVKTYLVGAGGLILFGAALAL
jgi:hypothetical protein